MIGRLQPTRINRRVLQHFRCCSSQRHANLSKFRVPSACPRVTRRHRVIFGCDNPDRLAQRRERKIAPALVASARILTRIVSFASACKSAAGWRTALRREALKRERAMFESSRFGALLGSRVEERGCVRLLHRRSHIRRIIVIVETIINERESCAPAKRENLFFFVRLSR
jgi:hypothetical protein